MLDFLYAVSDIVDAILFGKKAEQEKRQNRKWRLIGAGLILLLGIAGLVFALIEWGGTR